MEEKVCQARGLSGKIDLWDCVLEESWVGKDFMGMQIGIQLYLNGMLLNDKSPFVFGLKKIQISLLFYHSKLRHDQNSIHFS